MKKVRSSQASIWINVVLNWVKHNFPLWVSLKTTFQRSLVEEWAMKFNFSFNQILLADKLCLTYLGATKNQH